VKNSVTIAGVVGAYPSATYALTGADTTTDLPALGSTTGGSSYEWFQSDGTRITGSITANQTVTPNTATQTFNTGVYRSVTVNGDASLVTGNIKSGTTIFGVAGTVTPSPANCAADGAIGCVAVSTYPSAKLANFSAANVQSGITIAGVAGTIATCVADGVMGCLTATGFPSARLANFTGANVQSGTTIAGVAGTIASCTSDGQTGCVSSALLPAANVSGFSTWNLRTGTTLAGLSGTLKTNCRNTVNSSRFNYDGAVGSLGTGGVTSGTAFDYWDTIDDYYGFPSSRVTAWSTDTYCDSSTWLDRTTSNGGTSFTTCGTSSTCIYQDRITNLQVTGTISGGSPYNTTNTGSPASLAWNTAVQACAASTYGGYAAGSWRLPTQKELMSLYEHGIVSIAGANFISLDNMQNNYFWSSSPHVDPTTRAWYIYLANGSSYTYLKTTVTGSVVCVR
jgi:hypothetical protein